MSWLAGCCTWASARNNENTSADDVATADASEGRATRHPMPWEQHRWNEMVRLQEFEWVQDGTWKETLTRDDEAVERGNDGGLLCCLSSLSARHDLPTIGRWMWWSTQQSSSWRVQGPIKMKSFYANSFSLTHFLHEGIPEAIHRQITLSQALITPMDPIFFISDCSIQVAPPDQSNPSQSVSRSD